MSLIIIVVTIINAIVSALPEDSSCLSCHDLTCIGMSSQGSSLLITGV